MESQNSIAENKTPNHTQETNEAALSDMQEENIMDDILLNTSCILGNLFESSEADGNSGDTEGTSQNKSQPESVSKDSTWTNQTDTHKRQHMPRWNTIGPGIR